jgi:clan AA aspartic protease
MNGVVDNAGRALLDIAISAAQEGEAIPITAWIDTGFTGELVLPQSMVDRLAMPLTGTVSAVLADGSQNILGTYRCYVQWFGELRRIEAVANEGTHPLLGVGLLLEHELRINYRWKEIELL